MGQYNKQYPTHWITTLKRAWFFGDRNVTLGKETRRMLRCACLQRMRFVLLVRRNFYSHPTWRSRPSQMREATAQKKKKIHRVHLLLLLPNIRNSCLNFPLLCFSMGLRRGGNWSLRACGDSCLLHSFSCERQQSHLSSKGLVCFVQSKTLWGKEWEGPLWYFVVAIKLSLIAADIVSILGTRTERQPPTAAHGYLTLDKLQHKKNTVQVQL